MAFSKQSEQAAMSEINVTPLVDVMLVLLIVFIVTAPLLMQAVQVKLPKTEALNPVTQARVVQLSVNAEGSVFVDQRAIHLDVLEKELKTLLAQNPELSVQLHADEAVRYGRVAQVMAATQRAGIVKLGFVTVPQ
jgi:biopolymer transport protein ExbD